MAYWKNGDSNSANGYFIDNIGNTIVDTPIMRLVLFS